MAQPVTAILSRQGELAAKAWEVTQDTNEASLLVGKVVSRGFKAFENGATEDDVAQAMRGELERLIAQLRAPALH